MRLFSVMTGAGAGVVAAALLAAPGHAQTHVPVKVPGFHKVRYADSLVSPNYRCAVAQRKLSKNIVPVYVNGQPIGFC